MMITNHSSIIYSQIFSRLLNSAISDLSLSFVATSISSASTPLISFQKKYSCVCAPCWMKPHHHQIIMKMKKFCFWNDPWIIELMLLKLCPQCWYKNVFPPINAPPPDPFFTFVFLLALSPNYKFVFLNKLRRPTSAKDKKEIFPNFWYNAEDNRANDGPFVHLKLIFKI
jgi:hypothetical protein